MEGAEEREKGGAGRTLRQNRNSQRRGKVGWGGVGVGVGWGALLAHSPGPPSQVGELGGFLNSSLRRMVGGKVRVGRVRLPWPWPRPRPRPVMVAAAQRPSTPIVHGGRGGVGEVS